MTETIGFIGLGVLGSAIAGNLVKGGHAVIGFDIEVDKVRELEGEGAQSGTSPRDVADRSDVVILCLPTADALREVVGGADGLGVGGREGQIVLEVSTFAIADKEAARDALAASGKILLDCPVSGNRILALQRKLTAFGSGDRELTRPDRLTVEEHRAGATLSDPAAELGARESERLAEDPK